MALQRQHRAAGLQHYRPRSLNHDLPVTAGEHTISINSRVLLTYLPALSSLTFDVGTLNRNAIDLNRLTFQNSSMRLAQRFHETMLDALETLVKSLATNVERSEATTLELTNWLEESLRRIESRERRNARTYLRFTCLAFLGRLYRSERILALTSQFFVKHCDRLVGEEDEEMVLNWCSTIVSHLGPAERVGCLREVIVTRDDVMRDLRVALRYRGDRSGEIVLRAVQEVIARMSMMRQTRRTGHYDDLDAYELRGRQRQRRFADWDGNLDMYRSNRHLSDSPHRRRRTLQPWDDLHNGGGLEVGLRSLGIQDRRRSWSQDDSSSRQRLQQLERRIQDVEDAVTFVAWEKLNQAGYRYELDDWRSNDFGQNRRQDSLGWV